MKEATAAWHGLTAWAFTTFYLLSSTVGGVLGGVYNAVGERRRLRPSRARLVRVG